MHTKLSSLNQTHPETPTNTLPRKKRDVVHLSVTRKPQRDPACAGNPVTDNLPRPSYTSKLKRRPYGTLLQNKLISFPFNGFTYCLTLFSKFFASFPHGTCLLSVSCQYLALDGVYHPLYAALPSSATRRKGSHKRELFKNAQPRTGLSPSMAACSKAFRSHQSSD